MKDNRAYSLAYTISTGISVYMMLTDHGQLSESVGNIVRTGYASVFALSLLGFVDSLPRRKDSKKVL